jgi:hypothetical protein
MILQVWRWFQNGFSSQRARSTVLGLREVEVKALWVYRTPRARKDGPVEKKILYPLN